MLKIAKIDVFISLIRILFGVVFIYSAITKIIDIGEFRNALINFNMLTEPMLNILVYFIPIVELGFGTAIVFNFNTTVFARLLTLLLALFTAVLLCKLAEGAEISCGCFGELTKKNIDEWTIVRNIILMICGIFLAVFYQNKIVDKDASPKNRLIIYFDLIRKKTWFKDAYSFTIIIILFLLSTQTIIFSLQNEGLKSRLDYFLTDRETLQEGDEAKPFTAMDMNGRQQLVSFNTTESKDYLLLLFSVNCTPCFENLRNWETLLQSIDKNKVEILGVSLDSLTSTKNFAIKNQLDFPVYSVESGDFKFDYKGYITPQTILISNNGIVKETWAGMLNFIRQQQVLDKISNY